jgi:hypothetical protein
MVVTISGLQATARILTQAAGTERAGGRNVSGWSGAADGDAMSAERRNDDAKRNLKAECGEVANAQLPGSLQVCDRCIFERTRSF